MIRIIATDQAVREALHRYVTHIGYTDDQSCFVTLGSCRDEVGEADTVIISCELPNTTEQQGTGLDAARQLRSNPLRQCRGPIILLSFASRAYLTNKWHDSEVMNTKGVAVLRMPFLAEELKAVLEQTPTLSEAEWTQVNNSLRRADLKMRASQLRHRADSTWSTALTALLELEKLSYFKAPDPIRIQRHLHTVLVRLEESRLKEFEGQVIRMVQEAQAVGVLESAAMSETVQLSCTALRTYTTQIGRAIDESAGPPLELCRQAKETRQALNAVLDLISQVSKS